MSQDQGAGAPKPDGGAGTDQPGDVGKEVKRFMKKSGMWDRLDKMEQLITGLASKFDSAAKPAEPQQQASPSNSAPETQEKLTMKALQDAIQQERKARLDLETRLKEETQKTENANLRNETERRFAARLGADHPALPLVMDSFFDTRKRVVRQDGNVFVKFKGEYGGEDEFRQIDEAFDQMFDAKNGEFKHLVASPSKASNLPPRNLQNARGGSVTAQQRHPQSPIYEVVTRHFEQQGEQEKAVGLERSANSPNGQSQ